MKVRHQLIAAYKEELEQIAIHQSELEHRRQALEKKILQQSNLPARSFTAPIPVSTREMSEQGLLH
jgi:hypothetical protein